MIKESIRIVCDTVEMSSLVEKTLVEYGMKRLNDGLLIKNPIYFIISKDSKAYLISDSSEVFRWFISWVLILFANCAADFDIPACLYAIQAP